jgi:glycine cleavage system H protein
LNPEELKFAKTHEWVHVETDSAGDKISTMGISAFAVEALTDLVYIELPEVGTQATAGSSFCEIESVKAVSDIYAPVSGEVIAVNESLPDALETFNDSPYEAGWIAKIKISDDSSLADLMDHATYQKQCEQES